MLPDEVGGFRVEGGRVMGAKGVPRLSDPELLRPLRAWLDGVPDPYFVRFEDSGLPLDLVQRLARLGELWVDAGPTDTGDVLDLAFSGAARVVCDVGVVSDEDLEETFGATDGGVLLAVSKKHASRVEDAGAWAEEHEVPLLIREGVELFGVPDGVHVYGFTGRAGPERFLRQVSGPVEGGDDEE